ncbi:MAG: ComEC/Rec2 family competence protein [Ruminococcaceae bacterium]|nr:ComEC/Rec2 family competence protein [Oscillospiraceae bacterium]
MKLAEKRPAAFVCGIFVIISFLSVYFFRSPFFYVCLAVVSSILVISFIYAKNEDAVKRRIIIAFTFFAIIAPICNIAVNELHIIPRIREYSDKDPAEIKGVIVSSFSEDEHLRYVADVFEFSGKKAEYKILIEKFGDLTSFDTLFLPGDVISCKAVISPIDASDGYWYHYCSDGTYISADPESIQLLKSGEGTLARFLYNITEASKGYAETFGNSVFVRAVLFGDKSLISDELKENINNAGLSHYLAVSGLHLTLIIGGIFSFFKLLGVHRRVNSFISVLLCIGYMAICGFSPSVVRAGLMLIMYNISVIIRREADAPTSLCVASFLMMVLDPKCIYDIGFKLSFASTLGIIICASPYNRYLGEIVFFNSERPFVRFLTNIPLAVIRALTITFFALAFSFPFLLIEYRYINLLSPVYNLIITVIFVPLMYFILASVSLRFAADVFAFAGGAIDFTADLLSDASDMMTEAFEAVINFFGSFTGSVVYVGVSASLITSMVFLGVLIFFAARKVNVRFYPIIPLAVVIAAIFSSGVFYLFSREALGVYSVSDRTDEKLIMRYKNDIIIGELNTKGYYTSKHALEALAYEKGITNADGYFISSYSDKLPDQLQMVCKIITVDTIYLPYPADEREKDIFLDVFVFCSEKGIELERFAFGRVVVCKSFEVTFEKNVREDNKNTAIEMNVKTGNKTELLYTSCRECFKGAHSDKGDVLIHLNCIPYDDMEYDRRYYSGDIVKGDIYDESLTYVSDNVGYFGFRVYKKFDKENNPRLKTMTDR